MATPPVFDCKGDRKDQTVNLLNSPGEVNEIIRKRYTPSARSCVPGSARSGTPAIPLYLWNNPHGRQNIREIQELM
jgi:hypothetical protein